MICCTFAGHRDVYASAVEPGVRQALREIFAMDDYFHFYSGGMGSFDRLCERLVLEERQLNPKKDTRLMLVIPYMTRGLNADRVEYARRYDEIIYPAALDGMHYKAAIAVRNRWMVDQCQYLIACVRGNMGGAAATLKYAQRRSLTIWNVAASEHTITGANP